MLRTKRKFGVSWKGLNWRKIRERVCLLQFQIFNCIKYRNFKKALFQQKVLLLSSEVYYFSVRYITQLRLDRRIPGIDKFLIRRPYDRFKLYLEIKKKLHFWKCDSNQKVYLIDFLRGKILISVPTISDRIVQYIWGLTLEPIFNSWFFENQMPVSSISTSLFVKYGLILKLVTRLKCIAKTSIIFKLNIFSCLRLIFNSNYLLKVLFFPQYYKQSIIDSFSTNIVMYKKFRNEILHCYLHTFHFFVISLGFLNIKQVLLRELYSKNIFSLGQINVIFSYLDEMIFISNINQNNNHYITVIKKYILIKRIWKSLLLFDNCEDILKFHFLDWEIRLLKFSTFMMFPNHKIWAEYKKRFKKILKFNKYNIYQRVKFLEIFIQSRFYNNWFYSSKVFKREFYTLKIWFTKNIKKYASFFNYEKKIILSRIFKSSFFH
jgi:hypothetical protein